MKLFAKSKFKSFMLFAIAAIGLSLSTAAYAEKLVAAQIEVYDNVVRLGDIFEVNDIFASEELFKAPPLGRKGSINAAMLQKIANKYNLDWANELNTAKVYITRKAKKIELADVQQIIARYAAENQYIAGDISQTRVRLSQGFKNITIAASEYANFQVTEFTYLPYNDQFSIQFDYVQNGFQRELNLAGRIENMVQVPVFANNIARNQTIVESDIEYILVNNRRVADNIVLDVNDIVGKSAKNSIRALRPISGNLLKYADLVKKNSLINLQFQLGRIKLSLKARALSTGAKGDIIRVMNLKSGKQIDAIVTGIDQAMTLNSTQPQTSAKIALNN